MGHALSRTQPTPVVRPMRSLTLRDYYANLGTPTWVGPWRTHLLRLLGDWDRVLKATREDTYPGKVLSAPTGAVRDVARPCSFCRGPTTFTTARGRSVHPTCDGWTDLLTKDALADLVDAIADVFPVQSIEESQCLFGPARTLDVPDPMAKPS